MVKKKIDKLKENIESKINDLKEEIKELESLKKYWSSIFITIYISLFFWLISGVSLVGNQIIWASILILSIWFINYLFLYKMKSYIHTYRTVRDKFTKYINLDIESRNQMHKSINKLSPHVLKQTSQSLIMTLVMIICLTIICILPYFNSEITMFIFDDFPGILVILYLILVGKLIILLHPLKSFQYFHNNETKVESTFTEEKIRKIASEWKVQKVGTLFFIFLGIIPSIYCIGSIGYFIYFYRSDFDLSYDFIFVISVMLMISTYIMQKYSKLVTQHGIGCDMKNNLKNLLNRVENGDISDIDIIQQEINNIMYLKFQSEMKKL